MSERLGFGGGESTTPAVDTSQLEAINKLLTGDRDGVGFSLGEDGAVDFGVGRLDDHGQIVGNKNAASMTMLDTTKDVRAEVRDKATEVSARDPKQGKLRKIISKLGMSVPLVGAAAGAIVAAEKLPGITGALAYTARVFNRVVGNVVVRSTETKLIKGHKKDTSERYKDAVKRLEQDIEVDGDKIALLNEGETRREAQNESEAKFEATIKGMISDYVENVPTILNSSDADPDESRAKLESDISAVIESYNKSVNKSDASRGMFSANNFMQFADAARNALEQGAQVSNVRVGLDKVNMVYVEASSPVPEQHQGRMDKIAQTLHNVTRGVLNMDTVGIGVTAVAGIVSGSTQFGAMTASRALPIPGVSAVTAGAFAGVAEASRTNKERSRAARQLAYGEGNKVSEVMQGAIMEAKNAREITVAFGEQIANISNVVNSIKNFNKTGKGEKLQFTEADREAVLKQLADFDQRLLEQTSSGTPLFSFSSREAAEKEFWAMRGMRGKLQTMLAIYDTAQVIPVGSPDFKQALTGASGHISEELMNYLEQAENNEAKALGEERQLKEKVFKQLRLKRAMKTGAQIGLFVGAASAMRPIMESTLGAISPAAAKVGNFVGMTALFSPNIIRESKQILRSEQGFKDDKEPGTNGVKMTAREKEAEYQALLNKQKYGAVEATAQVDGARPQAEAPRNIDANNETQPQTPPPSQESTPSFVSADRRLALETANREKAEEIFLNQTGIKLPERALGQLFWDSLYASSGKEGVASPMITPDRGVTFDPQAVAEIMVERYNANPDMANIADAAVESEATTADTDSENMMNIIQRQEELPELRARRERATERFKQKFADRYPGRSLPSDADIMEMFRRGVGAVTRVAA